MIMLREPRLKDTRCAEAGVCSEFVTGCPLKCGRGVPKTSESVEKTSTRESAQQLFRDEFQEVDRDVVLIKNPR
jgi:hypothetical protein